MKNSDEKINQLLKSVGPISPRIDLAQKIIAQADSQYHVQSKVHPQAGNSPLEENIFKQIIRGLIFPKPAYALACSTLLGILLGWQSPEITGLPADLNGENNTNMTTTLVSVEEDLSRLFLAEVSYYE